MNFELLNFVPANNSDTKVFFISKGSVKANI